MLSEGALSRGAALRNRHILNALVRRPNDGQQDGGAVTAFSTPIFSCLRTDLPRSPQLATHPQLEISAAAISKATVMKLPSRV